MFNRHILGGALHTLTQIIKPLPQFGAPLCIFAAKFYEYGK
jgi:hypothetical protein